MGLFPGCRQTTQGEFAIPPRKVESADAAARNAAGAVADYIDEGEALGADDVQLGSDLRDRPVKTEAMSGQGRKTLADNGERFEFGTADGR